MQTTFSSATVRLTVFALLLSATALFAQGPLSPPAGPPAPSMKSLDQIEPRIAINATNTPGDGTSSFRITQPGSYHLTQNLTGLAGKNGIAIAAGGVTVDLNGFSLTGATGSLHGINAPALLRRVRVCNGDINGWDGAAINGANLIISQFENLRVSNNDGEGLIIGAASTIKDCVAQDNGAAGLRSGAGSTITGCTSRSNVTGINATEASILGCAVMQNTGNGITISGAGTISDCTVSENGLSGLFIPGGGGAISHSTFNGNGNHGIDMAGGSVIGCSARSNAGDGIRNNGSSVSLKDCVAKENARGIHTKGGDAISGCSASFNTGEGIVVDGSAATVVNCSATLNGGVGISTGRGCTVSDSVAAENVGTGIATFGSSTVSHCTAFKNGTSNATAHGIVGTMVNNCTASFNFGNGIQVGDGGSGGFAVENICRGNKFGGSGSGIFVADGYTRIEGNNVTENDRGIRVDGSHNLIIRNTAGLNTTNYDLVAGNRYGPILNLTAPPAAAVLGNAAPDTMGTTHPLANFAY